jgi:hypothetical protein
MRLLISLSLIFASALCAAPEMDLSRGNPVASSGSDTVSGSSAGLATTLDYTIVNSGSTALNVSGVTVSGETNCNVSISQPPASIAPGMTAMFQLTVTPIAAGTFSFSFSVANDDSDENPYAVSVGGNCSNPGTVGCYGPPPDESWMGCVAASGASAMPLVLLAMSLLALRRRR